MATQCRRSRHRSQSLYIYSTRSICKSMLLMIIIYLLWEYESKDIFDRFRSLLVTAMTRERKWLETIDIYISREFILLLAFFLSGPPTLRTYLYYAPHHLGLTEFMNRNNAQFLAYVQSKYVAWLLFIMRGRLSPRQLFRWIANHRATRWHWLGISRQHNTSDSFVSYRFGKILISLL